MANETIDGCSDEVVEAFLIQSRALLIHIVPEPDDIDKVTAAGIVSTIVSESVDSFWRDGADTPIVLVHRKALSRECSHTKPFWTPSYSISVFFYQIIPPKKLNCSKVILT